MVSISIVVAARKGCARLHCVLEDRARLRLGVLDPLRAPHPQFCRHARLLTISQEKNYCNSFLRLRTNYFECSRSSRSQKTRRTCDGFSNARYSAASIYLGELHHTTIICVAADDGLDQPR
jgi:hypothetical protein